MLSLYARIAAGVALVAILTAGYYGIRHKGVVIGRVEIQAKWNASEAARVLAERKATEERLQENARIATKQDNINAKITGKSNDELTKIRASLASERLRVGASFCSGSTTGTNPEGTTGSDAGNPGERLLSESVDESLKALILKTEEVAATGRACQSFVRENGM